MIDGFTGVAHHLVHMTRAGRLEKGSDCRIREGTVKEELINDDDPNLNDVLLGYVSSLLGRSATVYSVRATTGPGVVELRRGWCCSRPAKQPKVAKSISLKAFHPKGGTARGFPQRLSMRRLYPASFPICTSA